MGPPDTRSRTLGWALSEMVAPSATPPTSHLSPTHSHPHTGTPWSALQCTPIHTHTHTAARLVHRVQRWRSSGAHPCLPSRTRPAARVVAATPREVCRVREAARWPCRRRTPARPGPRRDCGKARWAGGVGWWSPPRILRHRRLQRCAGWGRGSMQRHVLLSGRAHSKRALIMEAPPGGGASAAVANALGGGVKRCPRVGGSALVRRTTMLWQPPSAGGQVSGTVEQGERLRPQVAPLVVPCWGGASLAP